MTRAPATPAAIPCTTSIIAFCTMLCGGQTSADMELFGHAKRELLQSFLKLDHGIPSHDTLPSHGSWVCLPPPPFQQWFIGFMRQFAEGSAGILAVDGKTWRRSYDRAEQLSPLHPVSAWAEEHGWRWGNWPWTPNPTRLRHCTICWKC